MPEIQNLVRLLLSLYGDEARFVAKARVGKQARERNAGEEWLWREVLCLLEDEAAFTHVH